jgi:hypothetical protein
MWLSGAANSLYLPLQSPPQGTSHGGMMPSAVSSRLMNSL